LQLLIIFPISIFFLQLATMICHFLKFLELRKSIWLIPVRPPRTDYIVYKCPYSSFCQHSY